MDDAEFIWKEAEAGKTLEDIDEMLQWKSIDKVKKHSALKQISPAAWAIIVPTFDTVGTIDEEIDGTQKVPTGTFTEGLLRSILNLDPEQQLELVQALASPDKTKRITKERLRKLAEASWR